MRQLKIEKIDFYDPILGILMVQFREQDVIRIAEIIIDKNTMLAYMVTSTMGKNKCTISRIRKSERGMSLAQLDDFINHDFYVYEENIAEGSKMSDETKIMIYGNRKQSAKEMKDILCKSVNIPENEGLGIVQFEATTSGPVPEPILGLAKHMLGIINRIKKSIGIKNGKEGNRG